MKREEVIAARNEIIEKSKRREKGIVDYISFQYKYPLLSQYVPGIMKGMLYMITAASGASKTQFTKDMFVVTPWDFLRRNPDCKINYKILYFALEETKNEFITSFYRKLIGEKHKIYYSTPEMNSNANYVLKDLDRQYVKSVDDDVADILKNVEVVDDCYHPTGIYKRTQKFLKKYYKRLERPVKVTKIEGGKKVTKIEKEYYYEPADPNLHVIIIVDHVNDILQEASTHYEEIKLANGDKKTKAHFMGKLSKSESISKWVDEYAKKEFTKKFNATVVNVVQQNAETEAKQFTYKGSSVVEKLEPSLANLGNNKEIQRTHYIILGLFSPDKHDVEVYNGYDIRKFGNYYRGLKVLKNRVGRTGHKFNFYHNGAVMEFRQMPDPEDSAKLKAIQRKIKNIELKTKLRNATGGKANKKQAPPKSLPQPESSK